MNSTIDPNKFYSIRYIANAQLFPFMTSHYTLTAYLETDKGKEIFKPVIKKTAKHTRYMIRGSVILDLLEQINNGLTIL